MSQTPAAILARMRSVSPSSPRLIWHGREGRIELSGRVFDNWVAKSSNLLVDELDAANGTVVELDLPVHWKSLALAFACWQVGCVVVLPDDAGQDTDAGSGTAASPDGREKIADVIMTSRAVPAVDPPRLLVCVALGSLALRWDGPLPGGAVDYAAEIRSHGDVFFGEEDDATAPLVHAGPAMLNAGDMASLVDTPAPGGGSDSASPDSASQSPTLLLEPGTDLLHALAAALAVWQQDGAIVLVEDGVPVTDRLLSGERVTARSGTA
ncbi:TIGR03089 family protein [Arthrobacter sp. B1805]|uniref:TIGR03089 family protein n=1 Tax=Arthrobacter sp. B1805 TaxID=2058892 RepID=UPI000CE2D0D6|nr:TIGR03089 family protein [Arthrobacter sp. B1805]